MVGDRKRCKWSNRYAQNAFYRLLSVAPFWAVSKVDFQVPHIEGCFHDQMAEEVYSIQNETFALKIILIRVASLERDDAMGARNARTFHEVLNAMAMPEKRPISSGDALDNVLSQQ